MAQDRNMHRESLLCLSGKVDMVQEARRQMRAVLAALWAVPLADVEARDANAKPVLRQTGDELSIGRATLRHTLPEADAPQKASAASMCLCLCLCLCLSSAGCGWGCRL